MKWMIASDLHGSAFYCRQMLAAFEREGADRLLMLGDLLYHGPRNDLPKGYAPKEVIPLLNGIRERLLCVRGNCDAEVDQMLLQFPIMADYALVVDNGRRLFLTHGHVYNEQNRPTLAHDIFVYGHTHLWKLEQTDEGDIVCNIGSITFPKGGNEPTFATYEDGQLIVRHLDGSIMKTLSTTPHQ